MSEWISVKDRLPETGIYVLASCTMKVRDKIDYRNIRIYYCSQCGHCSIIRTKGCPNCRAKMDKEETNELD